MKFYFDIPDDDFGDDYGIDFKERIKSGVIEQVADYFFNNEASDFCASAVHKQVEDIIKNKQKEIIGLVTDKVSEKIAQKKAVLEITPKASEFASMDKANEEYFSKLIDKAIAKKFK